MNIPDVRRHPNTIYDFVSEGYKNKSEAQRAKDKAATNLRRALEERLEQKRLRQYDV